MTGRDGREGRAIRLYKGKGERVHACSCTGKKGGSETDNNVPYTNQESHMYTQNFWTSRWGRGRGSEGQSTARDDGKNEMKTGRSIVECFLGRHFDCFLFRVCLCCHLPGCPSPILGFAGVYPPHLPPRRPINIPINPLNHTTRSGRRLNGPPPPRAPRPAAAAAPRATACAAGPPRSPARPASRTGIPSGSPGRGASPLSSGKAGGRC